MELSKRFEFKEVENKWCAYWEEKKIFHAEPNAKKKPYSIVIPPPNVTGILHMGHALNNTLQDIIIRYKRMQGHETCWMPGTDHAGIATQNVVEKQLAKEGKTRHDVGREELLKRLWAWKKEYGGTIINQLKKLGSSCDWERTRFTMDDHYSDVVKHVFVKLYEKGLVYRGKYIINWCPRCHTALSDEEAEHREQQGALYHIRYPFKENKKEYMVVATTRPETMLGDTAVAVNPKDERYKNLIGKTLILPILNREIQIIPDEFVDPEFGTGAVKVTPAHDPNDFQMGLRHKLEVINIMYPDGRLNAEAGDFAEMDRFEAREAIIETLKELKLMEKVEAHTHAVGHCYRCHTVVEPYLSKQWFVKMQPLAKPAIKVVEEGKIKFVPERWSKVYLNWMENIRDWCISRQIWWGHRIPVWYCPDCTEGENLIVSTTPPQECPKCHSTKLKQDEDVLDTWFSSWLWPFATFGWPQNSYQPSAISHQQDKNDLQYFYPTNSLFTASEIIFFWVARMIMAGLEFIGDIPFSDVYIHGTVRDAKGIKMSKSLGNAIDPLDIIEEYGADALRFSLIINSGQDIYISKEKFEIGRNFANKIWNAARLILMHTHNPDSNFSLEKIPEDENIDLPSRWIVTMLFLTRENVTSAIEKYRYSEAETQLYGFFWSQFCDWYLETVKDRWEDKMIQNITFKILEDFLKIIHPFMPFVSEEIYSKLKEGNQDLCLQSWPNLPKYSDNNQYEKIRKDMETVNLVITHTRFLRTNSNISPKKEIKCYFASTSKTNRNLLKDNGSTLKKLAKLNQIEIDEEFPIGVDLETSSIAEVKIKIGIPRKEISASIQTVDKKKKEKELEQSKKNFKELSDRLKNENFVNKAPKDVVAKEKARMVLLENKIHELEQVIQNLQS